MMKNAMAMTAWCLVVLLTAGAAAPEEQTDYPVSENKHGHENTEWSTSYGYHMADEKKTLPRVLLVGDSICQEYQSGVCSALEGKMTVTYWASSYNITVPCFLQFLQIYLNEAEYAVVHFNNGCHSLGTASDQLETALHAAFDLIKLKQPKAKIVWASTTPNRDAARNAKVIELNTVANKVVSDRKDIAVDDLYALMNPLDRNTYWRDDFHFKSAAISLQVEQVVDKCLKAKDDAGTVPVLMAQ